MYKRCDCWAKRRFLIKTETVQNIENKVRLKRAHLFESACLIKAYAKVKLNAYVKCTIMTSYVIHKNVFGNIRAEDR